MEENEFNYINVIPLVDVMLVLLTIALTTSTFIATGAIPMSLPQATLKQAQTVKNKVISIDPRGFIYFGTTPTSLEDLEPLLEDIDRDTSMIIRADRSVMFQFFVNVLDVLNNKGFKKITIQTERKESV
ncbi:MAG TPA: biopolymer transporter ExbD [Smithellaceae bacterium]|nr:biopolymer transporter ExbD [Smithellaceae bacterium]